MNVHIHDKTTLDEGSARSRGLYLYNTQHSQDTNNHVSGGIRTRNPSERMATGELNVNCDFNEIEDDILAYMKVQVGGGVGKAGKQGTPYCVSVGTSKVVCRRRGKETNVGCDNTNNFPLESVFFYQTCVDLKICIRRWSFPTF
jgi:hypothetical protein